MKQRKSCLLVAERTCSFPCTWGRGEKRKNPGCQRGSEDGRFRWGWTRAVVGGAGRENGCESSECRLARRGCLPQSEKWDQSGKTQQIMSLRGSSGFKIHRHVRTLGVGTDAAPCCCCVMLSLRLQDVKPLRPSDGLFVRFRISITRSKCALHG